MDTKINITVEDIPETEKADIKEITRLTPLLQAKRKTHETQEGEVLRGVHPKSHGCVDATFTVDDDFDCKYKIGLFKTPGTYKAKIRFSNASVLKLHDLSKDSEGKRPNQSRGMAIKVLGVDGDALFSDGEARNQDFLMVNTPEFAFNNVRDYLRLTNVLNEDLGGASPIPYFAPLALVKSHFLDSANLELKPLTGSEPDFIKKMWGFYKANDAFNGFTLKDLKGTFLSNTAIENIKNKTVRNPLQISYFSASPFRFGPDHVMKFSVVPTIETTQKEFTEDEKNELDPNFLAQALKETMTQRKGEEKKAPLEFDFMVQVVGKAELEADEEMIESAAKAWDVDKYPFEKVATITIPAVEEKENLDFVDACKGLRFTPWHSLVEHEPLGGINRLRKPVYIESAEFRKNPAINAKQELCEDN